MSNTNKLAKFPGGDKQWDEDVVLTDTDQITALFRIALATGAVTVKDITCTGTPMGFGGAGPTTKTTPSRSVATNYQNTGTTVLWVSVSVSVQASTSTSARTGATTGTMGIVQNCANAIAAVAQFQFFFPVQPGWYYSCGTAGDIINAWTEWA